MKRGKAVLVVGAYSWEAKGGGGLRVQGRRELARP